VQLITQEQIDGLPDDSEDAFVEFHRIVKQQLDQIAKAASQSFAPQHEEGPSPTLVEAREEYMILVAAAARQYGLAKPDSFDFDNYYEQEFRRLYRFATSEALRLSITAKARQSSITAELGNGPKARLRKHLGDLEAALEASEQPESRKKILRSKLAEFAAELEKPRSNIGRILAIVALIAAALGQGEDLIIKLPQTVEAVVKIIGDAKNEELPQTSASFSIVSGGEPKAIEGPQEKIAGDLDDEIPF
jgi:hypothetical protein